MRSEAEVGQGGVPHPLRVAGRPGLDSRKERHRDRERDRAVTPAGDWEYLVDIPDATDSAKGTSAESLSEEREDEARED